MLRTMKSSRKARIGFAAAALVLLFPLMGADCKPIESAHWGTDPIGHLDLVAGGNGEVRVAGWATQWDLFVDGVRRDQGPVQIVVMINGEWAQGAVSASNPRPDVQELFVSQRNWNYLQENQGYGFDFTKPAPSGEASVCVVALNQNLDIIESYGGAHVLLGCRTVTVT
jgi:hypothetical protein